VEYFGDQPYQPFGLMPIWWTVASAATLTIALSCLTVWLVIPLISRQET
jgi:hypothetical protein